MQDAIALKQFLQSVNPLLLILGTIGSRKTDLLSKAIDYSDPNHMVLRLKGRSNLPPSILMTVFSKHWALKTVGDEAIGINEKLNCIIKCLEEQQQHCLLLVEQAHLLPMTILNALCHLNHIQENKSIAIRIILVGYPELASKISALTSKNAGELNVIYLNKMPTQSIPQKREPFWQTRSVKTVAVLVLCMSGFLWWKMQESRVLFHDSDSIPMHAHHKRTHTA